MIGKFTADPGKRIGAVKPIRGFKPKINSGDLITTPAKVARSVIGNPLSPSNWLGAKHSFPGQGEGHGKAMLAQEKGDALLPQAMTNQLKTQGARTIIGGEMVRELSQKHEWKSSRSAAATRWSASPSNISTFCATN